VGLGNLAAAGPAVALLGLLVIAVLLARRVKGAMLIGILAAASAGWLAGLVRPGPLVYGPAQLSATALKLDLTSAFALKGSLALTLAEIIFVFLFVDLFDNVGTLVGVGKKAGLFDATGHIPRLNRILFADAAATLAGSIAGTSTVTSYIESAAGVVAGGRTGVTAVVTGLLFIAALFVAPLVGAVPVAATAPALILVGSLMISHTAEIRWSEPSIAIPAFLTILTIPLTFSIATGLSIGFTAFALMKLVRGELHRKDWLVYALAAIFIARLIYLGGL